MIYIEKVTMTASSDTDRQRVADLPGKIKTDLRSRLEFTIKFGLWRDYREWLPADEQQDWWYDDHVMLQNPVSLKITSGSKNLIEHAFCVFDTITMRLDLQDDDPNPIDLRLIIQGLKDLPVRDDTGQFVSGMIEIQRMTLQDVELTHLLPDTMYGIDTVINLPIQLPAYTWMINNLDKILGKSFPYDLTLSKGG